jgi:carbonic anhydrase
MVSKKTSRRIFLATSTTSVAGAVAGFAFSRVTGAFASSVPSVGTKAPTPTPLPSNKILQNLLAGNRRFQAGNLQYPNMSVERRQVVAKKQFPHAIVFGCVDSRVPPELVFDQGLGDIFTIRTAAHVIDNAALGSIEFGVAELGIPLLIVLGHERCGAVKATIEAMDKHEHAPGSIDFLANAIRPSVLSAKGTGDVHLDNAIRNNISCTVSALSSRSKIISDAVKAHKLTIVGSYYDLETGAVSVIA